MSHSIVRTILLLALVLYSEAQAQKPVAPATIKVMTFNIRYASNFGANSWPKRRNGVVQVIRNKKADLIGTQEGLHHQLLYMDKELKNHKWIGVGREGGNKGEFMAFVTAMLLAYQPLKALANLNTNLQEGLAATERVFKILDTKPSITGPPNAPTPATR